MLTNRLFPNSEFRNATGMHTNPNLNFGYAPGSLHRLSSHPRALALSLEPTSQNGVPNEVKSFVE